MSIKNMSGARELQKNYPDETKGLSLLEIEAIWAEYSDSMSAVWMNPNKQSVEYVFKDFKEQL